MIKLIVGEVKATVVSALYVKSAANATDGTDNKPIVVINIEPKTFFEIFM
jgi:hypothetical protein